MGDHGGALAAVGVIGEQDAVGMLMMRAWVLALLMTCSISVALRRRQAWSRLFSSHSMLSKITLSPPRPLCCTQYQ